MKILEFDIEGLIPFNNHFQISLDSRFLGQFVENSNGTVRLPSEKSTVVYFITEDSNQDEITTDFIPKATYKGATVRFEGGDFQTYDYNFSNLRVIERPGSDFGVEDKPEPSPFDVISRVRLSQKKPKFKVGDKVKVDPKGEWSLIWTTKPYNLRFDEVYTIKSISSMISGGFFVRLGIPSDKGGWSENSFISVDPEPSPFDVISKVRLSQTSQFKPGDLVMCISDGMIGWETNPWIRAGNVKVGNIYKVAEVFRKGQGVSDMGLGIDKDAITISDTKRGVIGSQINGWWWYNSNHFKLVTPEPSPFDIISKVKLSKNNRR